MADDKKPGDDAKKPTVRTPTAQEQEMARAWFDKAKQAIAASNFDYGIKLLLDCCKRDPGNLEYRKHLRATEKLKYNNNGRGKAMGWLTVGSARARIKAALASKNYARAIDEAESVLRSNPWDVAAQMGLAEACEALGLLDVAVFTLADARQKVPNDVNLNRALARVFEKRGNYSQAMALWELIRKAKPTDQEAQEKIKNLAAHDTIARGQYEAAAGLPGKPGEAPAEAQPGGAPAPPPSPLLARRNAPAQRAQPTDRVSREAAPLQARLESDPTNTITYLQLAAVYRRVNDLEQARAVLQKGLGPTGNAFELAQELADLDIETFRRDLSTAEERLKGSPTNPDLRANRDRLRKEVLARELDLHRRKAERFPTELAHRYHVGVRLLQLGQVDEAIQELQKSRADPRYRWQSLLYLGKGFKARNNWRLAQRSFEDALQALPAGDSEHRKDLLFELATGCAAAGDYSHAVDVGHDLANLDFAFRDIGRLLDDWQAKVEKD
jgi:tetratricopeptide (TPR) repeat protein